MTQHNPNLSLNQRGKDVALLQSRLITIGYTIDTPEILGEIFGESTYQAVLQFQQREGLDPTGVVDALTAEAIINRYESEKTTIAPRVSSAQPPEQSHVETTAHSDPDNDTDRPLRLSRCPCHHLSLK